MTHARAQGPSARTPGGRAELGRTRGREGGTARSQRQGEGKEQGFSGHAGLESFQADVPPPGTGSEDRAYAAPAVVSSEQPSRQGGRLRGGVSGSLRGLAQSPGPRAARHRPPRSVCRSPSLTVQMKIRWKFLLVP